MRISGTTAGRGVAALAVALLAAGLVAGLWGDAGRTEVPAWMAPASRAPAPSAAAMARPRAVPGGAATSTAGRRAPAPAEDVQAAVTAATAPLTAGRPADAVSVAALDTATGARVDVGAPAGITVASVFKLVLLEGYLLLDQDRGQAPGAGAPDALTAMIENSDNDAADQVYAALGGRAGTAALLARLGLTQTTLNPGDHWGLSTTGAADQLTALTDLVAGRSPLSAASRAYALGLMTSVEPDQRWGVSAAADPGTDVATKDGWLDVDDDGGRWVVSSVGVVRAGGHEVLLAVLTQHDSDLADGMALVEALSRTVATTLRDAG